MSTCLLPYSKPVLVAIVHHFIFDLMMIKITLVVDPLQTYAIITVL